MASFDFEKKWAELKEGIALVIDVCLGLETRKIERAEWATHYNTVYTWCTRPEEQKKEELYQNVSTFFDSVVAQQEEVKIKLLVLLHSQYFFCSYKF
jgi:hypothetical protein